jgi:hypothetical protein
MFQWPATDLDRPAKLLDLSGSFWATSYEGESFVQQLLGGVGQLENQAREDLQELIALTAQAQTPLWHRDRWFSLPLRESQANSAETSLWRFDDGSQFDAGRQFDVPPVLTTTAFPLNAPVQELLVLCDQPERPTKFWFAGQDFVLDASRQAILFYQNPFADEALSYEEILDPATGEVADRQLAVWGFRAGLEARYLATHWGYIAGLSLASSAAYREILTAIFESYVSGPTERQFVRALAALTGIPLVREDQETVVDVVTETTRLLVITDAHVYEFPRDAVSRVVPGETVRFGQALTDRLEIAGMPAATVLAGLPAVAVSRDWLQGDYQGELVFVNQTVFWEVSTDDDGRTRLEFPLQGHPQDVQRFWDEVHARGVAQGKTLAQYLDVRTNPGDEPTAASLPTTVNPLTFLFDNFWRYHTILVRYRPSQQATGMGLAHGRVLHQLLTPWTALILLAELELPGESVMIKRSGIAASGETAVDDALTPLRAGQLSETVVWSANVQDVLRARYLEGC